MLSKPFLAVVLSLSAGLALASPTSLQSTTITATYNGLASGMLGFDDSFAGDVGGNVTKLNPDDASGAGIEYLTSDYLFAIDFSQSGVVSIYNNSPVSSGPYVLNFNFAGISDTISGFSLTGLGAASGAPVLSVINSHQIGVDLSNVSWDGSFTPLTAQLAFTSAVPEPTVPAMLIAGLGVLGLSRRRNRAAC